jgi:hypothetical protein
MKNDELKWYDFLFLLIVMLTIAIAFTLPGCKQEHIQPTTIIDHFKFDVRIVKVQDISKEYHVSIREADYSINIDQFNKDKIVYWHNSNLSIDTLKYYFIIDSENCAANIDFYIYGKLRGSKITFVNDYVIFGKN